IYYWPYNGWMFLPLNFGERRPAINWPSCNGSVRRELALSIGGFDEQFTRTWYDDADFSWRLHKAGAKIVYDPCASLVHLKGPSGVPAEINSSCSMLNPGPPYSISGARISGCIVCGGILRGMSVVICVARSSCAGHISFVWLALILCKATGRRPRN